MRIEKTGDSKSLVENVFNAIEAIYDRDSDFYTLVEIIFDRYGIDMNEGKRVFVSFMSTVMDDFIFCGREDPLP